MSLLLSCLVDAPKLLGVQNGVMSVLGQFTMDLTCSESGAILRSGGQAALRSPLQRKAALVSQKVPAAFRTLTRLFGRLSHASAPPWR